MTIEKDFETYLTIDDVTVDGRDVRMLRAIDEHGSMSAAAEALGRSYPRLHQRVSELEAAAGALVERRRGGADRGGSTLTDAARDLLTRFDRLAAGYEGVARVDETVLRGPVSDRDGELGVVDADVGGVVAVLPPDADRAAVAIRSDAVVLTAPADAPEAGGTSFRNRFAGTVAWLETGDAVARVGVSIGDAELVALVTRRSVDALDLAAGTEVVASFKATAARGVAIDDRN